MAVSDEAGLWVFAWAACVVTVAGAAWRAGSLLITGALFGAWAIFAWERASGNER